MEPFGSSGSYHIGPKPSYRIFIAGIPAGTTTHRLLEHFRTFGEVKSIAEIGGGGYKPGKKGIQGGSCCLTVKNEGTFTAILAHSDHFVDDRKIICAEYTSGSDLFKKNADFNKRRVFCKKVEGRIPEDEVREYLQVRFGPIQTMFCLLPELERQKLEGAITHRKFRTYSVMFYDAFSAELAAGASPLSIKGCIPFRVEKFDNNTRRMIRGKSHLYGYSGDIYPNTTPIFDSQNLPQRVIGSEPVKTEPANIDALWHYRVDERRNNNNKPPKNLPDNKKDTSRNDASKYKLKDNKIKSLMFRKNISRSVEKPRPALEIQTEAKKVNDHFINVSKTAHKKRIFIRSQSTTDLEKGEIKDRECSHEIKPTHKAYSKIRKNFMEYRQACANYSLFSDRNLVFKVTLAMPWSLNPV